VKLRVGILHIIYEQGKLRERKFY